MEDTFDCAKDKDTSGEEDSDCAESKSKRLVKRVNSHNTLIKAKQLQRSRSYIKESFLRSIRVLDNWIPKHMVTIDEKYIRRCLEFIHLSASKAPTHNISINLDLNQPKIRSEFEFNFPRFHLDYPVEAGNGSVVITPAGHWIVGSIMGSKSMVNILNSPLFQKYGAFDGEENSTKLSFSDIDESVSYDFAKSPGALSNYSSNNLYKEATFPGKQSYKSETLNERPVSTSSSATSSDNSSSSICASNNRGMLQCSWRNGKPHFVFSVDDKKSVFVATLWKVESAVDYTYLFYTSKDGQKEPEIQDNESGLVGKMKVSTSFTLGPNNLKTMEREFVVFGGNEDSVRVQTSSHETKKNKGLPKKVAEVFRNSHSIRKRTISRFSGSSSILENCSMELFKDTENNTDGFLGYNLLDNNLPPNIELVAIVVKEKVPEVQKEKTGGWGLKFLQKPNVQQTTGGSGFCARNTGDCSTCMEILVPAGVHGGPRTRNGGPSGLVDRWRSGGGCDCGGWDLGCSLTVLKSTSISRDQECKLVDLIIQGSESIAPPLRMVNVYEGLYFVHFQSTLSALQSFAIAVAFIHSQSPELRPKNVQELQ